MHSTGFKKCSKDPLLVRSSGGYEPTSRALMAYAQLEKLLPQVESVIRGPRFDPREAPNSFTLSASDSTCLLIVPALARALVQEAPKVYVQVLPYDGGFRRLETNEVDLILSNNFDVGVWTGSPVRTESLFQEDWGCLVRKGHPSTKRRLTLRRYLKEKHVAIAAAGPRQRLVEKMLDKLGRHREVRLTLPYSLAVGPVAEQTNLIATLPKRVALRVATPGTQIIPAPAEFKPYQSCPN